MLISTELKEQRLLWIEWVNANEKLLDAAALNKFLDVFSQQLDTYEVDQFMLFFHMIQLDNCRRV